MNYGEKPDSWFTICNSVQREMTTLSLTDIHSWYQHNPLFGAAIIMVGGTVVLTAYLCLIKALRSKQPKIAKLLGV